MIDRMQPYYGGLTAEQFLFYEMRIVTGFFVEQIPVEEAIIQIRKDNLFQYPTEKQISRITRACYKRLYALDNLSLVRELATAPPQIAKQINLYAMMCNYRLVAEFMIQVIGEKFRNQDFSFTRKDLNVFFSRLQAQDDSVAGWSDTTIEKIKRVLVRSLVETEYLDNVRDTTLHPILLCEELEEGIRENGDYDALPAFNCFR